MSANGISTLQYKRDRVVAKLELAKAKRIAQNREPSDYSLDLLPTVPGIDSNEIADIVDNPNVGGLQTARPWVLNNPGSLSEIPDLSSGSGTFDLQNDDFVLDLNS